jgi:TonB family protein
LKYFFYIFIFLLLFPLNGSSQSSDASSEVYTLTEEMPEYPGGMSALSAFLSKNIDYPAVCRENGIQGKVFLKFVIDELGDLRSIEVIKSSGTDLLDKEALRVAHQMSRWKPGFLKGRAVKVYYNLPINFKIDEPAIEFNVNNQQAAYLEGKALLLKGDKNAATHRFETAGDADSYYVLGVLKYNDHDKKIAKAYFEKALEVSNDQTTKAYTKSKSYLTTYFN